MSESLFESDFNAVSDQDWIEKINKDLRGASFESLIWKLDDGSEIQPFYSHSRNASKDNEIHQAILAQLKTSSWKIIQDLRNTNKKEITKAIDSEVDEIICSVEDYSDKNKNLEYLADTKPSLESIIGIPTDNKIFIDPFTPWLNGEVKEFSFPLEGRNVFINGSYFHNAGATDQYDVSLTLSILNEHLHHFISNGINSKHIIIELGVGINFYLSIAKFRAIRILVQKLVELYDLDITFELRARTSEYWNSHKDQHTNLLRHTTMGLSAVLGSVDGLIVSPFEKANSQSLRLARNIQQLLKNESYLDKVDDMMAGSYLIEELTLLLIDKGWEEFRNIEAKGGFIALNNTGEIRDRILKQHTQRVAQLKNGEIVMIGVNKFHEEDSDSVIIKGAAESAPCCITKQVLSNEF